MRLVLHDYPGHAFPIQLSRALAARGHDVLHLYFSDFQSPRGPLAPRSDDPPGLTIQALSLDRPFQKYDFLRRALAERAYGKLLVEAVRRYRPDTVLGGNSPLDPQAMLQRFCASRGIGFVFWLQDIYGVAIDGILRKRLGPLGALIGQHYKRLERRLWRHSGQLVAITEDFLPILAQHGVAPARVHVIENWAVLDDIPERPRDNDFARRHGLTGQRVLLYSGTLGLKHDPALLAALARAFQDRADVTVLVVSEGIGADYLAERKRAEGLDRLQLLPFQPHESLPDLLASGDVLVVLLEADAGIYSVPSKVLSYCCAGRAVLGAIPPANLAARRIRSEGFGLVVPPGDQPGFVAAARRLIAEDGVRDEAGRRGRAYAEKSFAIGPIAARMEAILDAARRLG
jgi:colanic acid biosynthesis glycosyl transferase WcaI